MQFVPLVAMLALLKKLTDFVKQVTNRDVNGVVTQVVAWAGGILVVALSAKTNFANQIDIGGTLDKLNFASQVFIGLFVGSGGSVVHDYLQAKDVNNTLHVARLKILPKSTVKNTKEV